ELKMPSINSNTSALYAVNASRKTDRDMETSMQRLSTGLRITNAGDDASGAAISDRMTANIKGIEQSIRNAGDVISMAQVSEGALGEASSTLQRIRELAIQSASDVMSATERNYIQTEVSQLLAEFDRVTKDTTFNEINVLDGSFASRTFQIGIKKGESASVSVGSMRIDQLGAYEQSTDVNSSDYDASTGAKLVASATVANHVEADTMTISGQLGSANVTVTAGETARDIAKSINNIFESTGVDATASTQLKFEGLATSGNTGVVSVSFDLYGSNSTAVTISSSVNLGATTGASNFTELRDSINAYTAQTGVEALLSTDFSYLYLTQPEGYDIKIADINFDMETASDATSTLVNGSGSAIAAGATTLTLDSLAAGDVNSYITGVGIPAGTTITAVNGLVATLSAATTAEIADDAVVTVGAERFFKVTGMSEDLATSGYQVDLIDTNHSSGGLDSAIVTGQITMASSKQFTVNGDITKGLFTTNPGAATLNKLSGISVLTRQKSTDTLVVLDKAMDRINLERAKLGAIMSRMEKAVDNLSNVAMNTTASKGRIVDADFALESANLTRAQILQQSATAMIAQASKSMQTVLELLR
ncbi:flagellin, partial [Alphaproteobacteria bacterium]|nr:flagellin [Alphaproteobacteria bacterium]